MNYGVLTAVIGFLFLLSCSFFFSASETAVFHLHRLTIDKLSQKFKYLRILQHREILLGTILFGNTLVNVGVGAIGTYILYQIFPIFPKSMEFILIGITTCILLICGEITPKLFSLRKSETVAIKFTPILSIFRYLFLPFTLPLEALISRLSLKSASKLTKEEFRSFIKAESKEHNISTGEEGIILKLIDFKKLKASDLITSLPQVECIPISADLSQSGKFGPAYQLSGRYSRIPVYEGERKNIIGIFYIKDLLVRTGRVSLQEIIRKPYFIPPEMEVGELFLQFRRRKTHIAVVINQQSEALGIITLDDLINKIIK